MVRQAHSAPHGRRMNWALLVLSVATISRQALCAPAYNQYDLAQRQSVGVGGYQGPPVVPVILPGGFIADTEEVARAKDLHFKAYAQAAGSATHSQGPAEGYNVQPKYSPVPAESYNDQPKYTSAQHGYQQYSQQPQPQRQQDYNVPQHQYTGAVSRAYSPAPASPSPAYQQPAYTPQQRYQGPPVIPVVLSSGYIAETADVEAAKQHHFELVAQAQAAVARARQRYTPAVGYARPEDDGGYEEETEHYNQVYQAAPQASHSAPRRQPYQGPPAVPVVLPSGHIADTAEVAAAKISHLQQLLDAAQKSLPQQRYH